MEFLHFFMPLKKKKNNLSQLQYFLWVGILIYATTISLQAQVRPNTKLKKQPLKVQKPIQLPTINKAISTYESNQIEAIINDEIVKQELIGLAIGVVNNGQIALTKGYGYADRNSKKKVTLDSKFRWASMSKSLTSIAALKLVGKWEVGLGERHQSLCF